MVIAFSLQSKCMYTTYIGIRKDKLYCRLAHNIQICR